MNFQPSNDPWAKLVAAARNAPDERDTTAPYGFATRVTAQAWSQSTRGVSLLERFALRAVGVACLLAVGSVALNYNAITIPQPAGEVTASVESESLPAADDAVAIVLDFSAD
jgi:hypothetical protein